MIDSPLSVPQPTWSVPFDLMMAQQMGAGRQWSGVGGPGQMGAVTWPYGVGAGQVGAASSVQYWPLGVVGGTSQGLMGAPQMGGEAQWTGAGGVGQLGGVPLPVGVGAGQMGGIMDSSQMGVGVGPMGWDHQTRVEGVARRGGASSSSLVGAGQMGGIMGSSQVGVGAGQMVGTGPWVSAQAAGQMVGNRLRDGSLEGAHRSGGVTNSSLSVGGIGPLGGTSLGVAGGQHQVVDVVTGQMGVEGGRSLGGPSNSSLSVVGAGSMGEVVGMAAIPTVQAGQSKVEAIVVSDDEPATDAQPAAHPLDHVDDTTNRAAWQAKSYEHPVNAEMQYHHLLQLNGLMTPTTNAGDRFNLSVADGIFSLAKSAHEARRFDISHSNPLNIDRYVENIIASAEKSKDPTPLLNELNHLSNPFARQVEKAFYLAIRCLCRSLDACRGIARPLTQQGKRDQAVFEQLKW